ASGELITFAAVAIASLLLTLVVEVPVAALMGLRRGWEIAAVVCVNIITNPVVVWVAYAIGNSGLLGGLPGRLLWVVVGALWLLLEAAVTLVEWRLLTWALKKPSHDMLKVSLTMNAASATAGLVLTIVVPLLLGIPLGL
ncbi:MAG: hypothetical protein P4L93_10685, partial [Coriobacteriia bacterium]|nr:hypothetical protein [Coriobacteriia bacterium]